MIDFLIKSTISLTVLLLVYRLLLEREKMHRFNRFYLLFSLVFSMVLPFITIPVYVAAPVAPVDALLPETVFETATAVAPVPEVNYWPYVLLIMYCSIAIILCIRYLYNIRQFYTLKRRNVNKPYQEANLVLLESNVLPHTFLQNIYLSRKAFEQEAIEDDLLLHELTHVKQKHTLDILFTETLKVVLWFNPLLYFYKKAIQLNHEFLADESVLNEKQDALHYQELLLHTAATPYTVSLASNLNFSITKKRFTMMTKTTNPAKAFVLKTLLLPVFCILTGLLCTEEVIAQEKNPHTDADRVEVRPATKAELDSLRKINPEEYKDTDAEYSRISMYNKDAMGKETVTHQFIKRVKSSEMSPAFVNELKRMDAKNIKGINIDPATAKEMDSLKANHKTIADFNANEKYRKITVTYVDDNGLTKKKKIFAKEPEGINPTSVNTNLIGPQNKSALIATERQMDSVKRVNPDMLSKDPNKRYKTTVFRFMDKNGVVTEKKGYANLTEAEKEKVAKGPETGGAGVLEMWEEYNPDAPKQEDKVYNSAGLEMMPEYPGGMTGFYNYVNKSFKIPDVKENMTAKIYVSFVVEKDGTMSNIKCLRDPGYGLGDEAIRVLKEITEKWKPGSMEGKPVRASYNLPITINIRN